MSTRDINKELEDLKKEIAKIVGEKRLQKILKIVNISYQFDDQPEYKITHKVIE